MVREEMARHRRVRERRSVGPVALVLLIVVAGVLGAGAMRLIGSGGADADSGAGPDVCPGPSIVVAAAPEIATTLQGVVADAGCDQVTVNPVAPALVSARVAAGKDTPDVWIPDSSSWVARAATAAPETPQPLVESLATSPVVLVSADGEPPSSWLEALSSTDLIPGDPLTSAAAAVPLVAGSAEARATGVDLAATLVPLAQSQADARQAAPDDVTRLKKIASAGAGLTAVSEQEYLDTAPAGVVAAVPDAGTVMLDYPVLLTTGEERRADIDQTTRSLVEALGTDAARTALTEAGFRAPDGALVKGGVGDVTVLRAKAEDVGAVLRAWTTLVMPTRALSVVDVSGSMDYPVAGDQTRIQLLMAATSQGLGLFPDAAAIGLWAFSERLDGDTDYRELVPIRGLGEKVRNGTQRDAIQAGTASLAGLTGNGTGLYDTTLAAYREVLSGYDPDASNAVMLFTDGANDDPGSISLRELLAELRELADPARPVRIIAIGISGDADEDALRTIAQATGGQSYIAKNPADMPKVFSEAMGARTG
ncbi:VWA domain-containing protein [Nocardioides sp. GY 10113]|uniref:substrate-binding domain-containing protein n=1 Tax=Nocardioides sp. GY 10113 TaxID=2569761 RepID=UPI0010A7848E|nr:substrate-binding domain-containing protein [Nocardioides sp. GY 10113]TIC85933.1 VWA domain-containing protein [Nocardioides sp. GY 10113]